MAIPQCYPARVCGLYLSYASLKLRGVTAIAALLSVCQLSVAAEWLQKVPDALYPRTAWQALPEDTFVEIPVSKFEYAHSELAGQPVIALTPGAMVSFLGRKEALHCNGQLQPYLVRAIYMNGGTGRFSLSWSGDSLIVEHGSMGMGSQTKESALVACLSKVPVSVFSQVGSAL